MHRYDDAIGDCSRIIGLDSSRAEGYACRAQEELVKGDAPAAIADLGEVLKRAPGDAISLFNRADLEVQTQQWSAARADMVALSSTNSLDPESEDWCAYQLATSVHSELRDGKAAIALATRACEATGWGNVKYLETLAAAYAETGDFQQAIKWAQHAIEVARTTDPDPAVKNLLRWELTDRYEKGLPFRADDTGRIVSRPSGRTVLAIIATGLALIGLVTVIVLSGRLLLRLRRGTA
jgi:tetratricopeptide (TPR) repeat protein